MKSNKNDCLCCEKKIWTKSAGQSKNDVKTYVWPVYKAILYDFVISQGIEQNQLHRCYKDSVTSWRW